MVGRDRDGQADKPTNRRSGKPNIFCDMLRSVKKIKIFRFMLKLFY